MVLLIHESQENWIIKLLYAELDINSSICVSTDLIPFELVYSAAIQLLLGLVLDHYNLETGHNQFVQWC